MKLGRDIRSSDFDNSELGAFVQPRLATIAYSKHRWGWSQQKKIIHLIQEETVESEHIYTNFIEGDSFLLIVKKMARTQRNVIPFLHVS